MISGSQTFDPIPLENLTDSERMLALRANCQGSLFYFVKVGLRRKRLSNTFHFQMCKQLEKEFYKDLYEAPRDHFKSTIGTEGLPIWTTLPFTQKDIDYFLKLGYSDEFVRWMIRRHDPTKRNLLASENITNAAKLGKRIRTHFESNALFRALFHDILPTSDCTWTTYSLEINRPKYSSTHDGHGEGTFDFIGVGGALQSRHYNGLVVQDDLVGRRAIESNVEMDNTIGWHEVLPGAFECEDATQEGNELVIGNRWGYHDLNSHIREQEPWFKVSSHDALGGCCPLHPSDTPIFPEEFSYEKLMRLKQRFGNYQFSCQYRNNPSAPDNADFKAEWLNYFELKSDEFNSEGQDVDNGKYIHYEVKDGEIKKDLSVRHLSLGMICDPNHSGLAGRARHAIVVWGLSSKGDVYLLDCWAKASGFDELYNRIFDMAALWRQRKVGFETIAAQKYAAHHIMSENRFRPWPVKIFELNGEVEAPDGSVTHKKEFRIRNVLGPIAETGHMYIQRKHQDFFGEYTTFPKGKFVDLLDASAYFPQMVKAPYSASRNAAMLAANLERAKLVNQPYSMAIH